MTSIALTTRQTMAIDNARNAVTSSTTARPAPVPSLPPPSHGATASPMETITTLTGVENVFAEALASGDPSTLMAAVATRLRDLNLGSAEVDLRGNQTRQRAELNHQLEAYRHAEQSEDSSKTWRTLAKVGAYAAAVLAIVVGVAAAYYSGGTSLVGGIALAAVCISSAATIGVMAAQDTHAIEGPPPRWLMITIAVVALIGAVCSFGASSGSAVAMVGAAVSVTAQSVSVTADIGAELHAWNEPSPTFRMVLAGIAALGAITGAVGSMSTAVTKTSEAAKNIFEGTAEGLRGAALIAQGAGTIGTALYTAQTDAAMIEAHERQMRRQHLQNEDQDLIEAMKAVMKSFGQSMRTASDTENQVATTRSALVGNFARA